MRIRPADPRDLETVARANVALARETEGLSLDLERALCGVRAALEDPSRGRYLLAEVGGAVVGQLLITREWSDWRDGWYWWIQSVWIEPDTRRRGMFRALYARVLEDARKEGVLAVKLYVDRGNARAQATYRALGMVRARYDLFETEIGPRGPGGEAS
ncbi:MAG: GNAT family N-acetyltransferase [Deltaproteobacteria bacterium]|nr:GNAT family N-acetyltransferase [Deltaproteobacteria bacterium]